MEASSGVATRRRPERLNTELRALQRRFKQGYRWERTGGGHYRVIDRHGNYVEFRGKNITASSRPSPGVIQALEQQLTEARVLVGTEPRDVTEQQAQLRLDRLAEVRQERDARRTEEAKRLTGRFVHLFQPMGGINTPALSEDLGRVAALILRGERRNGMTPDLLSQNARRLLGGGWVEPRYQEVWDKLADRLESAGDTVGEWYSLLREARGLPRDTVHVRLPADAADEWPFRVELLTIDALLVDETYQRPVSWLFVRKEAARFDPSLVGTIDVAQRSPSRFAILDGQQRVEIVRLVGKGTVWASIYAGLDLASEARFFLHKNRDRKIVHPFYTYRAMLAAEDPIAVAVQAILDKHGYQLAVGAPSQDRPDNISAVSGVLKAYARKLPDGTAALDPTLAVLRASTYGRSRGADSMLIRGLASAFETKPEVDRELLTETVGELGPAVIIGRAKDARHSGQSTEQAVAAVLLGEVTRRTRKRR